MVTEKDKERIIEEISKLESEDKRYVLGIVEGIAITRESVKKEMAVAE